LKTKRLNLIFFFIFYRLSQNFTLSFFALKFLLLFRVFSLHFICKKHFFGIEAKIISLPFHFISLQSENVGNFRFFFVSFSLRFIFVSLQMYTFRIDAKQAKKMLLTFRFLSLRSENDGAPYFQLSPVSSHKKKKTLTVIILKHLSATSWPNSKARKCFLCLE
jgi:hypothetical protein